MMTLTETFDQKLRAQGGTVLLGQLRIEPGGWLGHRDDILPLKSNGALRPLRTLADVRSWINTDAAGNFRPVRGFKTLRPGWRMGPLSARQLVEVLHLIYPGSVADLIAHDQGTLPVTEFTETAARQTGMYRITQLLQPTQLNELTRDACDALCLRRRLWKPAHPGLRQENEWPVLCPEACNFFVGKAREKIKSKPAPEA
jgi:hypothetical protein